jgi:hypothetical protein
MTIDTTHTTVIDGEGMREKKHSNHENVGRKPLECLEFYSTPRAQITKDRRNHGREADASSFVATELRCASQSAYWRVRMLNVPMSS